MPWPLSTRALPKISRPELLETRMPAPEKSKFSGPPVVPTIVFQ
jgi:hypothetical protein